MSGLDLDKLKSQWAQETSKLDDSLTLDVAAVREVLERNTGKAFRRHSRWQMTGLFFSSLAFIAMLIFIIDHRDEALYLFMALPIAILALGEAITDFREWRTVRSLDFSAPLLTLEKTLDDVRDRRLRMTKWILVSSVLLWWPFILVILEGMLGIDLLPWVHPSVLIVNTLIGLAVIPVALWTMRFFSKRYGASPGYKKFMEESAGKSWSRARQQLDARRRFERDIETSGDAGALQRYEKKNLLSANANIRLRALKRLVLASTFAYGILVISIGLFNARHGGQWQFIVPGILLNLFWVSQMVSGITHRISLSRLDLSQPHGLIIEDLNRFLEMRLIFARVAMAAMPVVGTALLQVSAGTLFGLDLIGNANVYLLSGLLIALTAGSIAIYRNAGTGIVFTFANIAGFGSFSRSKMLVDVIQQAMPE